MTDMTTAEKIQAFEHQLQIAARRGQKAIEEFTKDTATNRGLLYALEWADDHARTVAQADLWATVQVYYEDGISGVEPKTLEAAILAVEVALEEITRQLLRDWIHQSSTSRFSNATAAAKAYGAARFHEEATGLLKHLTK
jgi:hypothetical protein